MFSGLPHEHDSQVEGSPWTLEELRRNHPNQLSACVFVYSGKTGEIYSYSYSYLCLRLRVCVSWRDDGNLLRRETTWTWDAAICSVNLNHVRPLNYDTLLHFWSFQHHTHSAVVPSHRIRCVGDQDHIWSTHNWHSHHRRFVKNQDLSRDCSQSSLIQVVLEYNLNKDERGIYNLILSLILL